MQFGKAEFSAAIASVSHDPSEICRLNLKKKKIL